MNLKMSLKEKIKEHLKQSYPNVIHGGEIEKLAINEGRKPSNASRRCRELENEGLIFNIYNRKNEVQYQWNGRDCDLNTQLRAILKRIEVKGNMWDYADAVKDVNSALRSNYDLSKQGVVNKYKNI